MNLDDTPPKVNEPTVHLTLIVTSLLVMICNSNNYPSKGNNDHACTSFQSQEYFKVSTGNQQAAKNQGAKWL